MTLSTLKKNWQFRTCYARGQKAVGDYAVVFYHKNPGAEGLQVGVVASKRVGGAVQRNRAKRLLRNAARRVADKLNHRDLWVVFVAKSTILDVSARDVQNDIERLLAQAGLLAETMNHRQTK